MNMLLVSSSLVSGAMLLLGVVNIYNYSVPLGEGTNDTTIMMYYDEPISEERWQEMEEADEKEHREESEEWNDDDDDDDDKDDEDND